MRTVIVATSLTVLGVFAAPTHAQPYYNTYSPYSAEPANPYYGQPNNSPSWAQPYQQPPLPSLPSVPQVGSYIPQPPSGPSGYPCTIPGCR